MKVIGVGIKAVLGMTAEILLEAGKTRTEVNDEEVGEGTTDKFSYRTSHITQHGKISRMNFAKLVGFI